MFADWSRNGVFSSAGLCEGDRIFLLCLLLCFKLPPWLSASDQGLEENNKREFYKINYLN